MADIPQGYRDIPEEDRKKAQAFFDRGRTVADTGNFEYAIEMFVQGLAIDPDSVEAHQTLRDISLRRKASGGKGLGMIERMRTKTSSKDDKQNLLNAEKLLAYDPGNTDLMVSMLQSAHRAGFYDTVLWIGPILQKANFDSGKQDFNKYIILKDTYRALERWKLAVDALSLAIAVRPNTMDLATELKNLSAQQTIQAGDYSAGDFRKSMKNAEFQKDLLEQDRDIRSEDSLLRSVHEAEKEYQENPSEPGKLMKLVDALVRTEQEEHENRAKDLLQQAFDQTQQFRFRHSKGRIYLAQLARQDRALIAQLRANPTDEDLKRKVTQFRRSRIEEELNEYTLWAENYPTDMRFHFEMAKRLFLLDRHDEAIPVFQHARNDPKFHIEASVYLGRAFLAAQFLDEAADTLKAVIDEYQLRGDDKSKEMYYWYGIALEQQNQAAPALKCYSQVAQWDFNYRDVQSRIKRLRTAQ